MSAPHWKVARLREIPAGFEMPGFSPDEYREAMAERAPDILQRWADAGQRFAHDHRKIAAHLGKRLARLVPLSGHRVVTV